MKPLIALALIYFCTSCSLSYKEHTQEICHKMISMPDIEPRGKAIVNVIFKADRPEQFMREIYADIRGGKQIVMTINGEATE